MAISRWMCTGRTNWLSGCHPEPGRMAQGFNFQRELSLLKLGLNLLRKRRLDRNIVERPQTLSAKNQEEAVLIGKLLLGRPMTWRDSG